MSRKLISFTVRALALVLVSSAHASLVISKVGTAYQINFDGFTGAGFTPSPSAGQLDSDDWAVKLSDSLVMDFGGSETAPQASGGRFANGLSGGGVSYGGVYAFEVVSGNPALGVQPIASPAAFTLGSFTLRLQNSTGGTLTALDLAYDVYVYNDQGRANSFNFSHSADNGAYASVTALDYTSPATKDTSPAWVATPRSTTLAGLSIANGANYYLRWSGDDVGGSGSRDEFALDNIRVTAVPEPGLAGFLGAAGLLAMMAGPQVGRWLRTRRAVT